jgi:hypothetical protein
MAIPPINNIIVSGAGTTLVNGLYYPGNDGHLLAYTLEDESCFIYSDDGNWMISDYNTVFYTAEIIGTPNECTWTAVDGDTPVPTVTSSVGGGFIKISPSLGGIQL